MAVTPGRMGVLARLASRAPVPVHVAVGHGGDRALSALRATPLVEVVTSPRHATVLVVAGHIPGSARDAIRQVHDQVPGPRATVVVGRSPGDVGLDAGVSARPDELIDLLVARHHDVLAGRIDDPTLGPASNPVTWQGVGPHGQGGEGMMGGVPWGRSMAMPPVAARDGLALDRLAVRLGPFLAGLPPLVVLDAGLQGDVLEEASLEQLAPDRSWSAPSAPPGVSELSALAELAALCGLSGLAVRTAGLAADGAWSVEQVADLRGRLDRRLGLRAATDDVGRLDVPGVSGDVTHRWRRWLERAAAVAVGDVVGPLEALDLAMLGDRLVGMEVGHALLTLASLRPELARTAMTTELAA